MENLLNCNGRRFRAKIEGVECVGKIRVEDGEVYLCQDDKCGTECKEKYGYCYSWKVTRYGVVLLDRVGVKNFRLIDMTASEIESYKDWQVGDKVRRPYDEIREVIFRSGKLVVLEQSNGKATGNFTCDELFDMGFRFVAEPATEDDTVELTMDEIAAKVGIPVEKLRIKKEENK